MLRAITIMMCATFGIKSTGGPNDQASGIGYSDYSESTACQAAESQAYNRIYCPSGQRPYSLSFSGCSCYNARTIDGERRDWNCDAWYSYSCGQ